MACSYTSDQLSAASSKNDMEARAVLPIQKLNRDGHCRSGNSEFTSSSLRVQPTTSDEDCAMLSQLQQILMDRELQKSPLVPNRTPFISDSSIAGSFSSSPAGFYERHPPFGTQSPDVGISSQSDKTYTWAFQPMTNNFSRQTTQVTWYSDTVQNITDYSGNNIVNNEIPSSTSMVPDEPKQTEWWTDIMDEDWNDILNDTTAVDSQSKVC